ncbi:MAG: cyanophycinase [Nostocaceae cyanobacterium]|nr:cyanophycinase [Nostocaceae cyanobacterium]
MENGKQRGQLVIIGGAEDKEGECKVLREFVRRAGGVKAKIVVLTAASSRPQEVGEEYIRVFERLGVANVRVVDTRYREEAEKPDVVKEIEQATGVFFSGGDQSRIISIIKGTKLDAAIHKRYSEGIVVGGTSAGAAMMPDIMIVEGKSDTHPRMNAVEMGPGMGFLPGVVVDQHFAQRGRLARLLAALLLEPAILGFGIDENTAVIVDGDEFEVVGEGAVTVVDDSETTYDNMDKLLKDEPLAVFGVKLHVLPQGYRFNLTTRQPMASFCSFPFGDR